MKVKENYKKVKENYMKVKENPVIWQKGQLLCRKILTPTEFRDKAAKTLTEV